jgi:N utilization substance protein B
VTTRTTADRPAGKTRSSGGKSARRRARELALQGLYEWLVGRTDVAAIDAHMREQDGFERSDSQHFDALLHGCVREAAALDAVLARHADRKTSEMSPVEHGVLLIGSYELAHCVDVPYKVAINEAVELAKRYASDEAAGLVNGILGKIARDGAMHS